MKKTKIRFISMLLAVILLASMLPINILAAEYESLRDRIKDLEQVAPEEIGNGLILDFIEADALVAYLSGHKAAYLGGMMLLVEGQESEIPAFEALPGIASVTYNDTVESAGYASQYDSMPDDTYCYYPHGTLSTATVNPYPLWKAVAQYADQKIITLKSITVAVLDTGIDGTHEDLADKMISGYDAIRDITIAGSSNSDCSEDSHGTAVAGLIAGSAYNGKGIAGAVGNFPVKIMPVRVLDKDGVGTIADVVRGIYYAMENGADVINMSFGSRRSTYPSALAKACEDARSLGIFLVAAAGNEGRSTTYEGFYPACLDSCLAVVSTGNYNEKYADAYNIATFSNNIPSGAKTGTDYTAVSGDALQSITQGNGYRVFSGTSASCAMVSGYVAVLYSLMGGRCRAGIVENTQMLIRCGHYANGDAGPRASGFQTYWMAPGSISNYLSYYVTSDFLAGKIDKIQSILTCNTTLTASAAVTAKVYLGASRIKDATLVIRNSNRDIIYTSPAVVNDGTDPKTYVFKFSVGEMPVGAAETAVTISVYFRTQDEVDSETAPVDAAHFAQKTGITLKGGLVTPDATIKLIDASGNEFQSTVYVSNAETGAFVATLFGDNLTLPQSRFGGKTLRFTCVTDDGVILSTDSGYKSEITLTMADYQTSVLTFADENTTLALADVYIELPTAVRQIGKTDENGNITVKMSTGTATFWCADQTNRYLVCTDITQDGMTTAFSCADDVSAATAFTVDSANYLEGSDNSIGVGRDYFAVGLAKSDVDNMAGMVTLGWYDKTQKTVYITPGKYYMTIGIFDCTGNATAATGYLYRDSYHKLGLVNTATVTSADFNPLVMKTTVKSVPGAKVSYGSEYSFAVTVQDDKGNQVIGGGAIYYEDRGTYSTNNFWDYEWDIMLTDSKGNEYPYVGRHGHDGVTEMICIDTNSLTAESATYSVSACAKVFDQGVGGLLPYSYESESDASLEVVLENALKVTATPAADFNSEYTINAEAYAIHNGEQIALKAYGYGATENADGTSYTMFNVSELSKGDLIAVFARVYDSEIEAERLHYVSGRWDPDEPELLLKPCTNHQKVTVTVDESYTGYSMVVGVPYEGKYISYQVGSGVYLPEGSYLIAGMVGCGENTDADSNLICNIAVFARPVTVGNEQVDIAVNTSEFHSMLISPDENTLLLYPTVSGMQIIFGDNYAHYLENKTNLLFDDTVDSLRLGIADSMEYLWDGGVLHSIRVPLTATEFIGKKSDVASLAVEPEKATFGTDESVVLNITALTAAGNRFVSLCTSYTGKMGSGITTYYAPMLRYRLSDSTEWNTVALTNWYRADLGKLAAGSYVAEISYTAPDDATLGITDKAATLCTFTVGGTSRHTVSLLVDEVIYKQAELIVSGTPGASVTLSYSSPSGKNGQLDAVIIPESGNYRFILTMTEDGTYTFHAVSVFNEDIIAATPITALCNIKPPADVYLSAAADGNLCVHLRWTTPENTKVLWLYRNGVRLGSFVPEQTEYIDKDLDADLIYTYYILAEGPAGTLSNPVYVSCKPVALADTEAPTAPAGTTAAAVGTRVTLTWTRSTDNVRVAGYYIYRNGDRIAQITGERRYIDKGLLSNQTYIYKVTAYDDSGNESAASPEATVLTDTSNAINSFETMLERNRSGDITGKTLSVRVGTNELTLSAKVKVVYRLKSDPTSDVTAEFLLEKTAGEWVGSWELPENILRITSVTAVAYGEDNSLLLEKSDTENFPCSSCGSIRVALNLPNAGYAQHQTSKYGYISVSGGGETFTLPIKQSGDIADYVFTELSSGTYRVSIVYKNRVIFSNESVTVGGGEETSVSADLCDYGFFRFKQPANALCYRIYGIDHFYDIYVDEDGWTCSSYAEGDSAFWLENKQTAQLACVTGYIMSGDSCYKIDSDKQVDLAALRSAGQYDYIVPVTLVEDTFILNIEMRSGALPLEGLAVRINNDRNTINATVYLDKNGKAVYILPKDSGQIQIWFAETNIYNKDKELLGTIAKFSKRFTPEGSSGTVSQTLPMVLKRTIPVELTSQNGLSLAGMKCALTDTYYKSTVSFTLDENGCASVPVRTSTDSDFILTVRDYYFSAAEMIEHTQLNGTDSFTGITLPVKTFETKFYSLKFVNPYGESLEGVTVDFVDRGRTWSAVLPADGTYETEAAGLEWTIRAQTYGENNLRRTQYTKGAAIGVALSEKDTAQPRECRVYVDVGIRITVPYGYCLYIRLNDSENIKPYNGDVYWINGMLPYGKTFADQSLAYFALPFLTTVTEYSFWYEHAHSILSAVSNVLTDNIRTVDESLYATSPIGNVTDLAGEYVNFSVVYHTADTVIGSFSGRNIPPLLGTDIQCALVPRAGNNFNVSDIRYIEECRSYDNMYHLLTPGDAPVDYTFGYYRTVKWSLTDENGVRHDAQISGKVFEMNQYTEVGYLNADSITITYPIAALRGIKIFYAWNGGIDAGSITLDITEQNDIGDLTLPYVPVYKLGRIREGDLDTVVKSVTEESGENGEYVFVQMAQNGAQNYQSLIRLPSGAYNIYVDGVQYTGYEANGGILLDSSNTYSISFCIAPDALDSDNEIKKYILPQRGIVTRLSLQFVSEIEYNSFLYGVKSSYSSNEILYQKTVNQKHAEAGEEAEEFDYFDIKANNFSLIGGRDWGLLDGNKYQWAREEDEYYYSDYVNSGTTSIEGAFVSFKTNRDDFQVAVRVDGIPVRYDYEYPKISVQQPIYDIAYYCGVRTIVEVSTPNYYGIMGNPWTGASSSDFESEEVGYEAGGEVYWTSKHRLMSNSMYSSSNHSGYLYLPMQEPETYPHTYKVEIFFRYYTADGELKTKTYTEEIRVNYNAPVLEKWNFTHLNINGLNGNQIYQSRDFIVNNREIKAYPHNSGTINLDWNGSTLFTFRAWFDKPDEVCNVRAVANLPSCCDYSSFPLTYDEEEGCYIGTGVLGDALCLPSGYSVFFDYASDMDYNGLPTVDINDLAYNANKQTEKDAYDTSNLPDGWTVKSAAPQNGWTLAECLEAWERFRKATEDGTVTEEELEAIWDPNKRLYTPNIEVYDENGVLQFIRSDYINFGEAEETDMSYSYAVMNGGVYLATLTQGTSIDADTHTIHRSLKATDNAFLVPDVVDDTVVSAGIGNVLSKIANAAAAAGSAIGGAASSAGSALGSAAIKAGQAASQAGHTLGNYAGKAGTAIGDFAGKVSSFDVDVRVGETASDIISVAQDANSTWGTLNMWEKMAADANMPDWTEYLTPEQLADYRSLVGFNGNDLLETIGGLLPGSELVFPFFDMWRSEKEQQTITTYKKIAEINKNTQRLSQRNAYFAANGEWPPDDWPWPENSPNGNGPLPFGGENPNSPTPSYHIDPSGYVFEGTEANRIEGVSATVYYLDGGEWVVWDSEKYGEGPNPNITNASGDYGWNVLIGKWKVIFEKDGYYTAESEVLNVPPAHTDVNISMVSTEAAKLKNVSATPEYLDFTFDKPVNPDDVSRLVKVLFGGDAISGTITPLDTALTASGNKQAASPNDVEAGKTVAMSFRFTPEDTEDFISGSSVLVVGSAGILTYNGIAMAAFTSDFCMIPATFADPITGFTYSGSTGMAVNDTLNLNDGLAVSGTEGEIKWKSLSPSVATVSESGVVTAKTAGTAYISVSSGDVQTVITVSVKDNRGDCNGDGIVSISDAAALLDYLADNANVPARGEDGLDVDGDKTVNISDLTALLDILASSAE